MKMKNFKAFLILILVISINFLTAQTVEEYLSQGDKLTKEFKNEKALEAYKNAEKIDSTNYEVKWRISRALVDIAEHLPAQTGEQEDKQLKMYETSLKYADEAVKLAPEKSITFLRKAIANGRIALFKGVFSVGSIVDQVKADAEKAIELNNGGNEFQGIAHYVLARTHAKISEKWAPARAVLGLGWADNEIAIEQFKKAAKLYPQLMMIHLDYARSLVREDMYQEAKKELETALNCPKLDEDDPGRLVEVKNLLTEVNEELE